MGLELPTFCYPGRFPKPLRLEKTSNSRLVSECIITDANNYKKKQLRLLDTLQTYVRKKECYYSISFGSGNLPTCTLHKRFKTTEPSETSFRA
jgi:hypothetical protein